VIRLLPYIYTVRTISILVAVMACMVFATVSGTAAIAADRDAERLVKRVREQAEDIKSLSCSYERTHIWTGTDLKQHIQGRLWLREPQYLRLEEKSKTIVTDGVITWLYLPRNKQVQIDTLAEGDEVFISPYTVMSRYISVRQPVIRGTETLGDRDCDIIDLITEDTDGKRVSVWIDRERAIPLKIVEETPGGDVTTTVVTDMEINPDIPDSLFTFEPPPDTEVLDLRE
jgi:outer membrane lipoprotein carrier protein